MNPELRFHPDAQAELLEAEGWYASRNLQAARAFVLDVSATVDRLLDAPQRWPVFEHGTRRIIFRRFPYSLIYRTQTSLIEVVALAHHR